MRTNSNVTFNRAKNRIYLYMEGSHDLEEAQRMYDEYAKAIEQASPGFTVLIDVENYTPGSDAVQDIHKQASHLAEENHVGKVARVVGDRPLGGMQIDRIAKHETRYESRHFTYKEDAEDFLDQ